VTVTNRYEGFREFVLARSAALTRTAYLLAGDHGLAEDLLQAALAKTAMRWPAVARGGDPEAYIRRVLYHEFVSGWRRRKRRPAELLTGALPERPHGGDESDHTLARLALGAALARLTNAQRAVLVLRFYEDRSEAETAELLGVSAGTVKSQTHRALARLRQLAPELGELAVGRPAGAVLTPGEVH
jgi:RNA polymerase sigma-70 factor (sigma-E family)